jgi:hypothetical protein
VSPAAAGSTDAERPEGGTTNTGPATAGSTNAEQAGGGIPNRIGGTEASIGKITDKEILFIPRGSR